LNFRQRSDPELARLAQEDPDGLLAYLVEARTANQIEAAVKAAQILAYSFDKQLRGFVFNKLGSKGPLVVENIAELTLVDGIKAAAAFKGHTMGEFRALLFTIARRRIADYLDKKQVDETPLDVDWGEGTHERDTTDSRRFTDPTTAIDDSSVFNLAFSELNDSHKLVIYLIRFYDCAHRDAAEQVNRHFEGQLTDPMTEQNVNQINSRFDKRLDELLREADDPSPPDADD
jgi:DNA-directed RNA polymerase specialized sigma24 family protein